MGALNSAGVASTTEGVVQMNRTVPPLKQALNDLAKEQERRARIWAMLGKRHQRPDYLAWADHDRRVAQHARRLARGLEY